MLRASILQVARKWSWTVSERCLRVGVEGPSKAPRLAPGNKTEPRTTRFLGPWPHFAKRSLSGRDYQVHFRPCIDIRTSRRILTDYLARRNRLAFRSRNITHSQHRTSERRRGRGLSHPGHSRHGNSSNISHAERGRQSGAGHGHHHIERALGSIRGKWISRRVPARIGHGPGEN